MKNRIFKARTIGIGVYSTEEAIEWGVTGPGLRATGMDWDFRKKQPYSGFEEFEFDIPVAHNGDCYDRSLSGSKKSGKVCASSNNAFIICRRDLINRIIG